jgi:hypothetical protein
MATFFFLSLCCFVGLFYLASEHQRLLSKPLPTRAARLTALIVAALGLLAGWLRFGPATGTFAALAWAMLWAGALPLIATAIGRKRR